MADPIQADELPTVRRMGDGVVLGLWRDNAVAATADLTLDEARRLLRDLLLAIGGGVGRPHPPRTLRAAYADAGLHRRSR